MPCKRKRFLRNSWKNDPNHQWLIQMNLAALVQSQTFATLLAALAPDSGLAAGKTVEARLVSLGKDGAATALINGIAIDLVLAGPEARQAPLQPGAVLTLRIDAPEEGIGLRATLLDLRPPAGDVPRPASAARPTEGLPPAIVDATAPAQNAAPVQRAQPAGPAAAAAPLPAAPLPPAGSVANPIEAANTARALAGPLLGPALARQDSMAPLFANLRVLANGSVSLVLPKPLMRLVDQILAQALPAERQPVTAAALRQAVARSGLFLEAREARKSEVPSVAAEPKAGPPQSDLKAGLTALRDMLRPLLETEPPQRTPNASDREPLATAAEAAPRPAPPRRDGPLAPQPPAEPSLAAAEKPLTIARTLLEQTEAALDRVKLAQFASLPPEPSRADASQGQRWLTEIPLALQNGIATLPLQIDREPPRRGPHEVEAPLWRVRFALDAEPLGPLQGALTLQGRAVSVSLWAEREETSRILRAAAPDLQAALATARFEDSAVDVHTGQPQARQAAAGQFLDRRS